MDVPSRLTPELYQAITAIVDDRLKAVTVTRPDLDQIMAEQKHLGSRMDRVEAALERLAEAQARTEARVEELVQAQVRTEKAVHALTNIVAGLKGSKLEVKYRNRVRSYWGRVLRGAEAFAPGDLEEELEQRLATADYYTLLDLDLVMRGKPRNLDLKEVWLALEISARVDRKDVERAIARATVLQKAGYPAVPAVAGERATTGARTFAGEHGVVINLGGKVEFWEQALAKISNGKSFRSSP